MTVKLEKVDNKTAYENLLVKYAELEKELEQEKNLNAEIKARFVKCNTCTDEMKDKCLMFSENLCEGERCEELVNLMALVSQSDLQKENEQLKEQIADIKANCDYVLEGKEIEHREERNKLCADFENMKATLESKIADLETQIEKMKCCYNCANDTLEPPEVISNGVCENCINHSKWELQYCGDKRK